MVSASVWFPSLQNLLALLVYLGLFQLVAHGLSTLSQKSETVAVVSPFSAAASLLCDSLTLVRQSHFTATVWTLDRALVPAIFTYLRVGCSWFLFPQFLTDN